MPETAMETARKLCIDLGLWGDPHFDADQQKAAAALDAYAAERIEDATDGDRTFARLAQVERERDAALARAEKAEANRRTDCRSHQVDAARAEQVCVVDPVCDYHIGVLGAELQDALTDRLDVARLRAEALHQDDVSQVCGLCFASGLPDTQLTHSLGCPLVEEAR